jgi:hypothetical protein
VHDLIDPPRRNIDRHRELILGDAEPLDEVLHQDLAGMDRRIELLRHDPSSVASNAVAASSRFSLRFAAL